MNHSLPYELDQRSVAAVVISSQLAFGSVGNNVIARLIERHHHRVVAVPTVLLSNLPHYPSLAGGAIDDAWLAGILEELLAREVLLSATYVCVGYLAHPGQARIIGEWFTRLKSMIPNIRLIVDPAMGDDDVGLYTAPEVVEGYAEFLMPLATGMTPNNFELGLLASVDSGDVITRARGMLGKELEWVAVTSASATESEQKFVRTLLVTKVNHWEINTPWVESRAKGAGDHFLGTTVAGLLDGLELEAAMEIAATATARALAGKDPDFAAR
ncbi:bifunctional pyridoxal kinase/hydroxymethylpyrimidine kinase [Arthrobacter sp. MYb227]|uniref:bifunctional hydroxymethylpyrimidine kinase/phosphomethylpyrimidine kinase n=1 Tax=Arthrobacter sp. MYb227 TaxID=1848601 RepID=UPI000CFAF40F|nr:bifunctional hydroxymethylpyrimidine kinase/phosphomethylpyrimidine kinase [Arthrobacter sp. MYb227]PQZ93634.1 bifunctional pyridoxal kinase/hydroxymethylpyrimidine kinase [Arthrobacter sp. MYb227]